MESHVGRRAALARCPHHSVSRVAPTAGTLPLQESPNGAMVMNTGCPGRPGHLGPKTHPPFGITGGCIMQRRDDLCLLTFGFERLADTTV